MDSRELGLLLAQQLLDAEDLHYGLWDNTLPVTIGNIAIAQQRYTDLILSAFPAPNLSKIEVLDIGCGTGNMMAQLLDKGYRVDGVIPSCGLKKLVEKKLEKYKEISQIFSCGFEAFPVHGTKYDLCLFSESFQYIPMADSFLKLKQILKPGGTIVICDFFKKDIRTTDQGNRIGGGHLEADFYATVQKSGFVITRNEDITSQVSPNYALVNDLLMNRIGPAGLSLWRYIQGNYPLIGWCISVFFRKKIDKYSKKYFSGLRTQENFEKAKVYRLMVLQYQP